MHSIRVRIVAWATSTPGMRRPVDGTIDAHQKDPYGSGPASYRWDGDGAGPGRDGRAARASLGHGAALGQRGDAAVYDGRAIAATGRTGGWWGVQPPGGSITRRSRARPAAGVELERRASRADNTTTPRWWCHNPQSGTFHLYTCGNRPGYRGSLDTRDFPIEVFWIHGGATATPVSLWLYITSSSSLYIKNKGIQGIPVIDQGVARWFSGVSGVVGYWVAGRDRRDTSASA